MDNLIKYFDNIETSFRKMKVITVTSVIACVTVCICSFAIAGWTIIETGNQVFVIDKGSAVMAQRTEEDANRDL